MVSFKEEQDFVLGRKLSVQENVFGNNKEIYYLGKRNLVILLDFMGIRIIV